MKITSFNNNINILKNSIKPARCGCVFTANLVKPTVDTFEKENTPTKNFLNKKGKVTLKEYNNILKKHPEIIDECRKIVSSENNFNLFSTPETIARLALDLKKHYDEIYGNYKIISIGTSPACVCEVMQNLGCDVIFAPISNLNNISMTASVHIRSSHPTIASRFPNIGLLMDYCTHKGIAKDKEKEIILLDFTSTGRTLRAFNKIIQERGDISEEKVHMHSIVKDLHESYRENGFSKYVMTQHLKSDMSASRVCKICNVPHFPCSDDDDFANLNMVVNPKRKIAFQVFKEFENYSQPKARAWALCATDEAMKLMRT